jgi:pilus assembly protein CpaD
MMVRWNNMPLSTTARRAVLVALIGLPIAACQSDRIVTGSVPTSVEDRYPIGVVPERTKLDLNATGYGLSEPDKVMVEEFILGWRRRGTGGLQIQAPVDTANAAEAASVIEDVKAIAYNYGMPVESIQVAGYHTTHRIAPVRLVYERMTTTLECGAWPTDAGGDWQNLPYENFGCASQKNLAAMVEDPRDLNGPRQQTPRDGQRRDTVYGKYRKGEDPSTVYNDSKNGQISEVAQ